MIPVPVTMRPCRMRRLLLLISICAALVRCGESGRARNAGGATGKSHSNRSSRRISSSDWEEAYPYDGEGDDDDDEDDGSNENLSESLFDADYYEGDEEYEYASDSDSQSADTNTGTSSYGFDPGEDEHDIKFEMPSLKSVFSHEKESQDKLSSGKGKGALYDAYNQLHTLAQVRRCV
jgi:hypothetical protein